MAPSPGVHHGNPMASSGVHHGTYGAPVPATQGGAPAGQFGFPHAQSSTSFPAPAPSGVSHATFGTPVSTPQRAAPAAPFGSPGPALQGGTPAAPPQGGASAGQFVFPHAQAPVFPAPTPDGVTFAHAQSAVLTPQVDPPTSSSVFTSSTTPRVRGNMRKPPPQGDRKPPPQGDSDGDDTINQDTINDNLYVDQGQDNINENLYVDQGQNSVSHRQKGSRRGSRTNRGGSRRSNRSTQSKTPNRFTSDM